MALQLIDLGNEVEVVEIDTSKVPYTFSVKLTDKTYTFTVKYNEAGSFFTVDLATSDGEPLVYGDIVRYGRPLFGSVEDERFPLPVIINAGYEGDLGVIFVGQVSGLSHKHSSTAWTTNITATGDVIAGGVSLKSHTHTCPDGQTSPPQ